MKNINVILKNTTDSLYAPILWTGLGYFVVPGFSSCKNLT